jgi:cytochrome c1
MTKHRTIVALALAGALLALSVPASAEEQVSPPRVKWSFAGPFGKFNEAQLQRGFKIYKEVCSNCHSMDLLSIGSLADPGGPGFSEAQVAALAAGYNIKDLNDRGDQVERPGRPADHFPAPFANELAAKAANGGTAPPDMSTLPRRAAIRAASPGSCSTWSPSIRSMGRTTSRRC